MRLDARQGARGLLVRLDTGQPVRWVVWADVPESPEQPGEFEAWRFHPDECKRRYAGGVPREQLVYRERCRLRFVPAAPLFAPKPSDPRDLIGSLEEGRRRFARPRRVARVTGTGRPECDEPLCHRPADWSVSDEQEIEPERDADGKQYERAVTVRPRFYCHAHYANPTFTDLRGVQSEVPEEIARPQW